MKVNMRFLTAMFCLLAVAACKDDKDEPIVPDVPAKVAVTGVTASKSTVTLMEGESETVTATVSPDNATDKTVSWKSSDGGVATVDANGKIVAIAVGEAIITVTTTDGDKTATVKVVVDKEPVPNTEPGWTTGFENLKGKDVLPVSYFVFSHPSTIQWNFTFVDDATLAEPNYQFMLEVTTESEGTPTLDMLATDNVKSYKVHLIDNANHLEYVDSEDNDGELQIMTNDDGTWKFFIEGLSITDVNDETNGAFIGFTFNGDLSLVEYAWTTNFAKLKGKDVLPVSYYYPKANSSNIAMIFTFVDDASLAKPNQEITLEVVTTNPDGTPTLDMMNDNEISSYSLHIIDYANDMEYVSSKDNDGELEISKNADGSWSINASDVYMEDANDETHGTYIDLKFNGELTLSDIPAYCWTTSFAKLYGKDVLPVSYAASTDDPTKLSWTFTFVDDVTLPVPNYVFTLEVETENPGDNPTLDMLDGISSLTYSISFMDNAQGEEWVDSSGNDGELQITKKDDGSWRIFIDGLSIVKADDETKGSWFNFEFNGRLTISE